MGFSFRPSIEGLDFFWRRDMLVNCCSGRRGIQNAALLLVSGERTFSLSHMVTQMLT